MNYVWPILLQALAFAVLFAEIVIPSFGLLSVAALALGGWSWYLVVTQLPAGALVGFGIADLILVPLALKFTFSYLGRSPVSHRGDVGVGSGLEERDRALAALVGRVAETDVPLRPSGKIRLDGEVYEAHTAGEFLEAGATVRIAALRGHGFLVEKIS